MQSRHSLKSLRPALHLALACGLALLSAGCGGGGNDTVTPPATFPPFIILANLPDGVVGTAYSATVTVIGGETPLTFSVTAGTLPAGLMLNTSTGEISGTPTTAQTQTFTVQVRDNQGRTDDQEYAVRIGTATVLVELVSVVAGGGPANSDSGDPALSDDGRFVAFTSFATNLIASDTNGVTDVFLRDRACNQTLRVSVATDGTPGDKNSFGPSLSALNGGVLLVAYTSDSTNLVPMDTNNTRDVFVTALTVSGCTVTPVGTVRASVATDGTEGNNISTTPNLAANGSRVAYHSFATNLDQADTNAQSDIFVTDLSFDGMTNTLSAGPTRRIGLFKARLADGVPRTTANIFSDTTIGSVSLNMTPNTHVGKFVELISGTGAPQTRKIGANTATTITIDGAEPDFDPAPNHTTVFQVSTGNDVTADIFTDTTIGNMGLTMADDEHNGRLVKIVSGIGADQIRLITDGTATTFTVGTAWNPIPDGTSVFRVLSQNAGGASRGRLTADGALAGYGSDGAVLVEVVASSDINLANVNVTGGNALGSSFSTISANGNLVLFQGSASNIVDGDTNNAPDLFLRDLTAQASARVSLANDGSQANAGSEIVADLSGGGRLVAFTSTATNLVTEDRDAVRDVFLRDTIAGTTVRISQGMGGTNPNGESFDAALSLDGSTVAFQSAATNLIPNDITGATAQRDVFVVCSDGSLGYPCAGILDPPLIIVSGLPAVRLSSSYNATLQAVGGAQPLYWSITDGSLPPGLFLDSSTGQISGLPRQGPGRYTFTVEVMDASRPMRTATREITLVVE